MNEQFLDLDGIRLHTITSGPEDGALIIFLHGFPDFWITWRKQTQFFTGAGYRVCAPDQRGYNLSDKPKGIEP